MNFRKHLAGFAIFSVIVGCAIFVNHFLAATNVPIPRIPISAPPPPPRPVAEEAQSVSYKVRSVSIDLANRQTYTVLNLSRRPGQPAPEEKVWVTTVFFSPDRPTGKVLMSSVAIRNPFARSDSLEYVAINSCDWCGDVNFRGASYFARVYVSVGDPTSSYADFDDDITRAEPVVLHWPDVRKPLNKIQ